MEARSALLLGLLSVFGIAVAEDEAFSVTSQNQPPSFCRNIACPKYELVKKYDSFELRQYEETRWVRTSLKQDFFGLQMVASFRRLFKYISGNNAEELKINMTLPVVIYMPLKQPPAGNSTMSFFVSHEVENPPEPTNPEVYLDSVPTASFYVKTFGGYALEFTYKKQAKALAEELRNRDLPFDDSYFVRVGYNPPYEFENRHNEVWYMAK
ncbi:heme-binding protein 2-like [Anomaloglossus baeobatrachus]|uniref:heme-binding protein 2-like n=1 Tax=Anomaloglossus baeobatrachus TaxID=238106 RepID=UPI003F4FDAE3